MVIFYCERCGRRIPDADREEGRTQTDAEGNLICAACAAAAGARPSPATGIVPASSAIGSGRASATGPVPRPSTATHAERPGKATSRTPSGAKKPSSVAVVVVLGVVVGGGAAVVALLFSQGREEATPAALAKTNAPEAPAAPAKASSPPTATVPRTVAVPQPAPPRPAVGGQPSAPAATVPAAAAPKTQDVFDPRGEAAASLLTQAQAFQKANPEDVWAYKDKLDVIKERYGGTASAAEAVRLLADIKLPEPDPATNPVPPPETAWAGATQVLPLVNPSKGRQNGNWSMSGGVLRSDKSMWARLALPYTLPDEYDLRVTFSRVDNWDCLLVVLGRKGRPFIFSVGSGNQNCSFETVKESRRDSLPTKTVKPNLYPNNQRCQIVIQVRSKCLRAHLNGKPIVGCQVEDEGLSLTPELTTPRPNQLGLCTWNSVYEFHAIEVLPLTGEGRILEDQR
jgi:hypothetical protein